MRKILIVFSAAVALLIFPAAATTAAAAKPPITVSQSGVPLVDDDGVTREFHVSYDYRYSTGRTTCTYTLPSGIEGQYVAPAGTAPIIDRQAAIDYCISVFKLRGHPYGDPTPAL